VNGMDYIADIMLVMRKIIIIVAVVYIAASAILYVFQDRLIFFRQTLTRERLQYIQDRFPGSEEVSIMTPDSIELRGWLLHGKSEGPSPLLIYFGGNAEEVSWMMEFGNQAPEWSFLLVNYRGYGMSGGKPGEKDMLSDALLLYDTFSSRNDIDEKNIAVMGRSLGTAVAVYLSANRPVTGTVLVSPYASIEELAQSNFPVFPVRFLIKHRFNVLPLASGIENPMLAIIASDDTIIPMIHSRRLYDEWKGEKNLREIPDSDHNTLILNDLYWEYISRFLNGLARD
jgi:uncharacterized protein